MKQFMILAIILMLSSAGWAQENEQTKINESFRNELKSEYLNYINRVDFERNMFFVLTSILLAIGGIVTPIMVHSLSKEQAKKILDKISAQIASDPNALIAALREKSIELDLKRDFNLILIYHGQKENNRSHLMDVLSEFGFKNCFEKNENEIKDLKLDQNHVLLLFDDTDEKDGPSSKWLNQSIQKDIWNHKSKCGYLFINNHRLNHNFETNEVKCFGACNSGSTIYNNLMSLLHYKRYLNNHS